MCVCNSKPSLLSLKIWWRHAAFANKKKSSIHYEENSPMARETRVQSQVESYQRLQKWHLIPPCSVLSIKRYGSRVKWNIPANGVAPSPTPRCGSYWKRSLRVSLYNGGQLYFMKKIFLAKYKIIRVPDTVKWADNSSNLIELLIVTACQPVLNDIMPEHEGIAVIVYLYLHFCVIVS